MTQAQSDKPPTDRSPDPRTVLDFHRNSDVDSRNEAMHHTIGLSGSQASPGNHIHDGVTSIALLEGVSFTGSISNDPEVVLKQITQALALLGAVDNTSA